MLNATGKLTDSTVIVLPDEWKGVADPDTIVVQLTPFGCAQELFVKSIDYGHRIIVQSSSGGTVNCYYSVQANEVSQG